MSLMTTFAANLKDYRCKKNLSQEKLAELSGLHRPYIGAVERERRNISIASIEKIAQALEIDAYLLFKTKSVCFYALNISLRCHPDLNL